MKDLNLIGRADNEVAVGDLMRILLSISLASKRAMLDWEWLGIDLVEWPSQILWIGRSVGLSIFVLLRT